MSAAGRLCAPWHYAAEAARMLRCANRNVTHANRRPGYFPEPDGYATPRQRAERVGGVAYRAHQGGSGVAYRER
jgi:hypothetical protein